MKDNPEYQTDDTLVRRDALKGHDDGLCPAWTSHYDHSGEHT